MRNRACAATLALHRARGALAGVPSLSAMVIGLALAGSAVPARAAAPSTSSAFTPSAATAPAAAAPLVPVYRCSPSAGSSAAVLYTDQPCPQGYRQQTVQALDSRSTAQTQAAQAQVREQGQWANTMAQQRRREEGRLADQAQRHPTVIGREQVNISRSARSDALRQAELRRMSRPHHSGPKGSAPEPPAAAGGSAPKARPDRP